MKKKNKVILTTLSTLGVSFFSSFSIANNNSKISDDNLLKAQINQATRTKTFSAFGNEMQYYDANQLVENKELLLKLVMNNLIEFSDQTINTNPIAKFNITKEEFIKSENPQIEFRYINLPKIPNVTTQIKFDFKYGNELNKNTINDIVITDLRPNIVFDLMNGNVFSVLNNESIFSNYTADEFAKNFRNNVLGWENDPNKDKNNLISFINSSSDIGNKLIETNLSYDDTKKMRVNFDVGVVDNINGTIKNNKITISLPYINKVTSEWKYSDDEFKDKTISFDLIDFAKSPINVIFNSNNSFDVSNNEIVKELTVDLFNENIFINELIQYSSTSLKESTYLLSVNYDKVNFLNSFDSIKLTNLNQEEGTIDIEFAIKIDNKLISKKYQLFGFKKLININSKTDFIKNTNFNFLNNKNVLNFIKDNNDLEIRKLVLENIESFFVGKSAIYNVKNDKFVKEYIDLNTLKVTIYQKLGQLKIIFPIKSSPSIIYHLNNKEISDNELELIVSFDELKDYYFNFESTILHNEYAFNLVSSDIESFIDNFVQINGVASKLKCIETNLSRQEIIHIIESITFEKSYEYKAATIQIIYKDQNWKMQPQTISIISNVDSLDFKKDSEEAFDVSKYDELRTKSVDTFTKDDFLNLIGYNNIKNDYGIMTVNCSKNIFKNALVNDLKFSKKNTSINVTLKLNDGKEVRTLNFSVVNLQPMLENWAWYMILGISGLFLIGIIVFLVLIYMRKIKKKKVLKVNPWN